MRKICFGLLSLFLFQSAYSQNELSLDECYKLTRDHYPLSLAKEKNTNLTSIKSQIIKTAWLPTLNLNAQATYQSAVTQMNIPIPTIKIASVSKDQYKATIDLSQLIWDGGSVKALQAIENIGLDAEIQSIDVKLYQLKDRVNQIFFSILLLQQKASLLETLKQDLESKLKTVQSGVQNGYVLSSNEDQLKAEILKIEQQISENQISISTSYKILSQFVGKEISSETKLKNPEFTEGNTSINSRPEYLFFDKQLSKLDALTSLTKTDRQPKAFAFGQLGYGRPGLNMLNDNFDTFYYIGAKFTWNIWDYNVSKRKINSYTIQKELINIEKQTFDQNLTISIQQYLGQIDQLNDLIKKDAEIIALRSKISKSANSQYESGLIKSSEYITEVNAETTAKLNLELHKMQLLLAKASLSFLKGQ